METRMNRIRGFVTIGTSISLSCVVVYCLPVRIYAGENDNGVTKSIPYAYDSNAIARAKEILAFEEHEKKAPRYRSAITNWNPVFPECDGITNIIFRGESGGDYGTTRNYLGLDRDRDRWITVRVECFQSSRDAHEYLVRKRSNPATETWKIEAVIKEGEVTDPKERIGFRCFTNTLRNVGEEVEFVRNNFCIGLFGKDVKVGTLARELDRQILELSQEIPKDSQWTTTALVLGDEAVDKVKRRVAFEEWEQQQKHSSVVVATNWTPDLAVLPSTNVVLVTDEVSDGTRYRKWHATMDDGLHMYMDVVVLRSSRDAHEFMMNHFRRADLAKVEEYPSRGVGDRGFLVRTKQTVTGVVFIRGNVFFSSALFAAGKPSEDLLRIDLTKVARAIDNQILTYK